jgi:hypothetical protein
VPARWRLPWLLAREATTLKDAIQCKDFKRDADGSWYAEDVWLSHGSGKNQLQLNLFGPTTIAKAETFGGVDLWSLLNEKCGCWPLAAWNTGGGRANAQPGARQAIAEETEAAFDPADHDPVDRMIRKEP